MKESAKHQIYGIITMNNGIPIPFLQFVDKIFTLEKAKKEAMRIVMGQHCVTNPKQCVITETN